MISNTIINQLADDTRVKKISYGISANDYIFATLHCSERSYLELTPEQTGSLSSKINQYVNPFSLESMLEYDINDSYGDELTITFSQWPF